MEKKLLSNVDIWRLSWNPWLSVVYAWNDLDVHVTFGIQLSVVLQDSCVANNIISKMALMSVMVISLSNTMGLLTGPWLEWKHMRQLVWSVRNTGETTDICQIGGKNY